MLSRPGRWLVLLRGVLVVVGAIAVGLTSFPPGYEPWAWAVVGFFTAVTVFSGALSVIELGPVARVRARVLLLALDAVVAIGGLVVELHRRRGHLARDRAGVKAAGLQRHGRASVACAFRRSR